MTRPLQWSSLATLLAAAVALAACGKTQQAATEKAMEHALEKDGATKASVDLGKDGQAMKVTTTDAAGKTTTAEIGGAQIGEAELGLPFYPGSKPVEGQSTRVATGDGTALTVALHSDDAADKVAGFYRDKLKAMAQGKQFLDMSTGDGNAMLALSDDAAKQGLQVHVSKAEKGTDVQIVAQRSPAK